MAKKLDRVSVGAWEKIAKQMREEPTALDWHGDKLIIKKRLTMAEAVAYVRLVTTSCFSKEDGSYQPEALGFAKKRCAVALYTNVTLPQDMEKQYDLIYGTDIMDAVMGCIDLEQYNEMCEAVADHIDSILDANIDRVQQRIEAAAKAMEEISSSLGSVFDGLEQKDVHAMMHALTEGRFDEEKLMQAYLDQTKAQA